MAMPQEDCAVGFFIFTWKHIKIIIRNELIVYNINFLVVTCTMYFWKRLVEIKGVEKSSSENWKTKQGPKST